MIDTQTLDLLADVHERITNENLSAIQTTIDKDKYEVSLRQNRDVCGDYADFCAYCDKSLNYPCAAAYIKRRKAESVSNEAAATDGVIPEEIKEEVQEDIIAVHTPDSTAENEVPPETEQENLTELTEEEEIKTESDVQSDVIELSNTGKAKGRTIRIAIAKRKKQ